MKNPILILTLIMLCLTPITQLQTYAPTFLFIDFWMKRLDGSTQHLLHEWPVLGLGGGNITIPLWKIPKIWVQIENNTLIIGKLASITSQFKEGFPANSLQCNITYRQVRTYPNLPKPV